jgi:hypothetical protein
MQQPLPLLFFISSRPEVHIRETFDEPLLGGVYRGLDVQQSFTDVRKYLRHEFSRIHREHGTMVRVPRPWPSSEVVEDLVEKSSGYFIYAATITRYIDNRSFRPPDRLKIILGLTKPAVGPPFDMIDQLYIQILSDVPLEFRPRLLRILTAIVGKVTYYLTPFDLEQLLELQPGDISLILRGLHSILNVPGVESSGSILAHHASFLDFLDSSTRSGPFHISDSHRTDLVRYILKALASTGNDLGPGHVRHVAW